MEEQRVASWQSSTKEERQMLYEVVKEIMAAYDLSMDVVFNRAYGRNMSRSDHEDRNFAKGIIGHKKIAPVYRWVVENHLRLACEIAPELFDASTLTSWSEFISVHGVYGHLTTRPDTRS